MKNNYNSNKQNKINSLDYEQRNYKPIIEDEDVDTSQKHIYKGIDFSDLVNTFEVIETTMMSKADEANKTRQNQSVSDLVKKLIGEVIQKKRKELQITQEALSDKANLSRSYISDIESGKVEMSLVSLFLISQGLGLNPSVLVNEVFTKIPSEKNKKDKEAMFIKNIDILVGAKSYVKATVYKVDKGTKIVLSDDDFKYYKNKYGTTIFFHFDKNENNICMSNLDEKNILRYKYQVVDTDSNNAITAR